MEKIILESGNEILESTILELAETEMCEGCHMDYVEDYETPLDFYLSDIEKGDYIEYIEERLYDGSLSIEDLEEIRKIVIQKIIDLTEGE